MTDDNQHAKQVEAQKEAAKKRIAEEKAAREQAAKQAPEPGKPTPTQEENDLAAQGVHVIDKEPDGSPEQSSVLHPQTLHGTQHGTHSTKQSAPDKPTGGGYQTRASRPTENV